MRWSWTGAVALVLAATVGTGWVVAVAVIARADEPPIGAVLAVVSIGSTLAGALAGWLGGRRGGDRSGEDEDR